MRVVVVSFSPTESHLLALNASVSFYLFAIEGGNDFIGERNQPFNHLVNNVDHFSERKLSRKHKENDPSSINHVKYKLITP